MSAMFTIVPGTEPNLMVVSAQKFASDIAAVSFRSEDFLLENNTISIAAIIFYEDRNFQGRFHECDSDSSDLHSYLSRCNSIRVEGGFWVIYERPNYMGYQYVLNPGEYPDYQRWLGINDTIRSCRIIRNVGNLWRLKVWERPNFEGLSMEVADNIPAFQERWHSREVHSCKVFDGAWIFYEHPNYRGRQYLLERGMYRRSTEWGGVQPTVGSIRRVKEH